MIFNNIWVVFEYLKKITTHDYINPQLALAFVKLIIQENQWTKGMEAIKIFNGYKKLNGEQGFLSLFDTLELINEPNNSRKEVFVISLFLFCCEKAIIGFEKEKIKKGTLIFNDNLPLSVIRLLFIQTMEYISRNHPLFNTNNDSRSKNLIANSLGTNSSKNLWWSKDFRFILPNTMKYKGQYIPKKNILARVADELKNLNPPFNIYDEANLIVNSRKPIHKNKYVHELVLSRSYISKWINEAYRHHRYTVFDIINITAPSKSYFSETSLIFEEDESIDSM
jgi:hypothetical protein